MAYSSSGRLARPTDKSAAHSVANPSLNPIVNCTFTGKRKADQFGAPEEQTAIKLVEVDTDGDLTFRVGTRYTAKLDRPLDIKVARHAMTSGSPMFKTMLSSRFMESEAAIIELPEDSPTAFLEFCKILHHKTTNLEHLSGFEVWELAIVADMRQSQHVLRPWILDATGEAYTDIEENLDDQDWDTVNCQPFNRCTSSTFDIGQLFEIGAIFGLARLFWAATRALLFNGTFGDQLTSSSELLCLPSISHPNGENVYEIVAEAARAQCKAIFTDVSSWVNKRFVNTGGLVDGRDYTCQARKYGTLQMLSSEQMGPPENVDKISRSESVKAVLERLKQLHLYFILPGHFHATKMLDTKCTVAKSLGKDCKYCKRGFMDELQDLRYSRRDKLLGICLKCFEAGAVDCFATWEHVLYCTGHAIEPESGQGWTTTVKSSIVRRC